MKTQKRRRRENKTDYLKRLKLLKSHKPRIVFRRTNKYIIAQYIESKAAQDKIIIGISSKKLLEKGWPKESEGSLKSIPASYLTGYLIGKQIKTKKLPEPIVDLGLAQPLHKTKIYAFIKGAVDSGLKIKCDKECFPEESRIQGKHLKNDFSEIFNKIKSNLEKNE